MQLIITAAIVAAPATAVAQAEEDRRAEASLRVYADDDHVTVWSPSAAVVVPLSEATVVEASTTIDALTAASIDVTSTASPYAFSEQRVEASLAGRHAVRARHWLGARATYSDEPDYASLQVGLSWLAELAARNATLELASTVAFDTVGRVGDPAFAEARRGLRVTASLTQVTDPSGYVDVVVDADRSAGYLANPYRYVPITMDGVVAYALPERVPDDRTSVAALARIRRAAGGGWYGHADARLCRDTWDLTSVTGSARATRALRDDALLLAIELRGYVQTGASFVRAAYAGDAGAPAWRTRDRTLGPMTSVTAAGIVDTALPWHDALLTGSLAWVRFAWPDDPRQRRRDAVISSVALRLTF